jgi:hypothetical protein
VIVNSSASTAAPKDAEMWTIRGLLARHKLVALAVAVVVAVMLAMILLAAFGPKAVNVVSDTTTCTGWGSANQDQQAAYGRLYLREHGPLRGVGGNSPASVIQTINYRCGMAYGEDVSDTTTLVQAISGHY